jgi:formylglycine-generating enzyme required for sulfatase activity
MYPSGATQQGVLDMAGNLWEWCLNTHAQPEPPELVRIDEKNEFRMRRGGSWSSDPSTLLVSKGSMYQPDYDYSDLNGFRLVRDIP